jgi:hypothetical protein
MQATAQEGQRMSAIAASMQQSIMNIQAQNQQLGMQAQQQMQALMMLQQESQSKGLRVAGLEDLLRRNAEFASLASNSESQFGNLARSFSGLRKQLEDTSSQQSGSSYGNGEKRDGNTVVNVTIDNTDTNSDTSTIDLENSSAIEDSSDDDNFDLEERIKKLESQATSIKSKLITQVTTAKELKTNNARS